MAVDPLRLTRFLDQGEYRVLTGAAYDRAHPPHPSLGYKTRLSLRYSRAKGIPFEKFEGTSDDLPDDTRISRPGSGVPLGDEEGKHGALPTEMDSDLLHTSLSRPGSARMEPPRLRGFVVVQPEPVEGVQARGGPELPMGKSKRLSPIARAAGFDMDEETGRVVQVSGGLMAPRERRLLLKMETDAQRAEKLRRRLVSRQVRLGAILDRSYRSGIRGVLPESEMKDEVGDGIRLDSASRRRAKTAAVRTRRARVEEERARVLQEWQESGVRRGYDIIAPTRRGIDPAEPLLGPAREEDGDGGMGEEVVREVGGVKVRKRGRRKGRRSRSIVDGTLHEMTAKRRSETMDKYHQKTHERLFGGSVRVRPNTVRIQRQVNRESNGRVYDVVTHHRRPEGRRPTTPEKKIKRLLHPSLADATKFCDR